MILRRAVAFTLVLLVASLGSKAQELFTNVEVNAELVQTQERQVFTDMQQAIRQFVNTQEWTADKFEEEERINSDINIIFDEESTLTSFLATAQIQSRRPVYGTSYETTVLQFFDNKWRFEYNVSDPMIFSENVYSTELTSLIAYYAYIILGIDYDTFSPKGGDPYFERALNIRNNSQNQGGAGWNTLGGDTRDRAWLVENLINPQFEPFRQALYEYHRLGLDVLESDGDEARKAILEALKKIAEVKKIVPISVTLNAFFDAKAEELYYVFSQGDMAVRQEAMEIAIQLDPTNANIYKKALKQ